MEVLLYLPVDFESVSAASFAAIYNSIVLVVLLQQSKVRAADYRNPKRPKSQQQLQPSPCAYKDPATALMWRSPLLWQLWQQATVLTHKRQSSFNTYVRQELHLKSWLEFRCRNANWVQIKVCCYLCSTFEVTSTNKKAFC